MVTSSFFHLPTPMRLGDPLRPSLASATQREAGERRTKEPYLSYVLYAGNTLTYQLAVRTCGFL